MQTSQDHHMHGAGGVHGIYFQHAPEMTPYFSYSNLYPESVGNAPKISFEALDEGLCTLVSVPPSGMYNVCASPSAGSTSSNRSQFSPQGSRSYISDPHHSSDSNYGSPLSGSSVVDDNSELKNRLRELEHSLLGPDSCITDSGHYCSLSNIGAHEASTTLGQVMQLAPKLDLKQMLSICARVVAENDLSASEYLMDELGKRVSVCGTPIERLAAYMLEGLRARLELSGYTIYRKLRCEQPTGAQLLSYMHILYDVCPYYQFAYTSANHIILEAMQNESSIHIIDFQIGMGTQWVLLFQSLANRPGRRPLVHITGVDDPTSTYARGGGLEIVGQRLSKCAESCGVPFQFHAAAMSGFEVKQENLGVQPGQALAVNFSYMLHHMPDESVSTTNHRDRLLRLIKRLSPRVVTLVEQESNTNTSPFMQRFLETLSYYTAMFESLDVALPRDDKKRINAEQHCLARDIVNMIACENEERVERHELFGKWRARLSMAGFTQLPVSVPVNNAIRELMRKFNQSYSLQECQGTLYLGWKGRSLSTSSAWR